MKHLIIFLILYLVLNWINCNDFDEINQLDNNLIKNLISKYNFKNEQIFLNNQLHTQPNQFKIINNRIIRDDNNLYSELNEKKNYLNKNKNLEINYFNPINDFLINNGIRDEEILEKSMLWRHQMMQGGAGEGEQKLKPDGSIKNIQVIKTDSIIPSYCTPPNPCPLGYSSEDGCIEKFINTASYSRNYQSMQNCMCDSEHMFNCENTLANKIKEKNYDDNDINYKLTNKEKNNNNNNEDEKELNSIAQSLANQSLNQEEANYLINLLLDHKVVAKKFFIKKKKNDYFTNERLPVMAKKSLYFTD